VEPNSNKIIDISFKTSGECLLTVRNVLLLGNPDLYEVSKIVEPDELNSLSPIITDLHDTLMDFRKRYGAGRGIAAPQIGARKRIIYTSIETPVVYINPRIEFPNDELIELWDDCMCFPDLLVRVRRHRVCKISYLDMKWNSHSQYLEDDLSELLQHEYDHLDGILAVDRAIDSKSFCFKCEIDKRTTDTL